MRRSTFFGLLLVVIGVLYLFNQMGITLIPITFDVLWPLAFVLIGLGELGNRRRHRVPWWSIFLILFGLFLSVRNSHVFPILDNISVWNFVWALFLVFLGLSLLWPRKRRKPVSFNIQFGDDRPDESGTIDVHEIKDYYKKAKDKNGGSMRRMIGDLSIGAQPWALKDMTLWNGIGDTRINLATAHIENGTYHLDVSGFIGDIRILLPQGLAVSVDARLKLGDVTVFGDNQSGVGRHIRHEDPEFMDAEKRVMINAELFVGDLSIARV